MTNESVETNVENAQIGEVTPIVDAQKAVKKEVKAQVKKANPEKAKAAKPAKPKAAKAAETVVIEQNPPRADKKYIEQGDFMIPVE